MPPAMQQTEKQKGDEKRETGERRRENELQHIKVQI